MSDDEEKTIEAISDYLDGTLAGAERDEVAKKIDGDPEWKRVHDDLVELRKNVSGMQKQRASDTFAQDVTSTIHKRSAGRFFARRTLGDRVPFGALLVVAVLLLAVIGYVMWSSQTGSLKVEHDRGSATGSGLGIAP
jgi:anti-sigma factor RsiW